MADSEPYTSYIVHTLVIIKTITKILLGYKKRGSGEGKWNGFGGKVKDGETVESAAVRELKEECGLHCEEKDLTKVGTLDFAWLNQPEMSFVHVFKTEKFSGQVVESAEMRPKWFPLTKIPYHQMWTSDQVWLPLLLENKPFRGYFLYNSSGGVVESKIDTITNTQNNDVAQ